MKMTERDLKRFYDKVEMCPMSGCHLWIGGAQVWGYGNFYMKPHVMSAHRVAYLMKHGSIPDGMIVRHKCDTPQCVNPDHLEVGTTSDNIADKINRRRDVRKISLEDRVKVAASNKTYAELADEYGVSVSTINKIKVLSNKGLIQ